MLSLFKGSLLPVQADFGIALAMGNACHTKVHAHLRALALEIRHQLLKNVLLILFADVSVVLHGFSINAVLMLGSQLCSLGHLFELGSGNTADRALLGRGGTLGNITTNCANPFFHNTYPP